MTNVSHETGGTTVLGGNQTVPDKKGGINLSMGYVVLSHEQNRTRLKKQLFLETFSKTKGVIITTCEKAEVGRATYYEWLNADPVFAEAVRKIEADKNSVAEDILWGKITFEKDGPSVRYFLDRKHPGFKPTTKVEHQITGDRTLEDLLDGSEKNNDTNQPGTDRGANEDPQQAGGDSAVQAEPGAAVVDEAKDAAKPDTESPAGGAK